MYQGLMEDVLTDQINYWIVIVLSEENGELAMI